MLGWLIQPTWHTFKETKSEPASAAGRLEASERFVVCRECRTNFEPEQGHSLEEPVLCSRCKAIIGTILHFNERTQTQ